MIMSCAWNIEDLQFDGNLGILSLSANQLGRSPGQLNKSVVLGQIKCILIYFIPRKICTIQAPRNKAKLFPTVKECSQ